MKKIPKNIQFEDAMIELEAQVRLLESGELSLEQAFDTFKYGVDLSKICMEKLETVQQQVEKIMPVNSGENEYKLEPFQDMEEK